MVRGRNKQAFVFIWIFVSALLSQKNLAIPAVPTSFEEQKNFYFPDPHAGTPPTGSHTSPPTGSSSPPHVSGGRAPPISHGTPPSNSNLRPSTPHRGSGSHQTPPSNDPATPSTPNSHGGGNHHSPPTSGCTPTPVVVSPPRTTTPVIVSPPIIPITIPGTPNTPTIPGIPISSPPFDPNSNPFIGTCNYWRTHPAAIWGLLGSWGTLGGAFGVAGASGFSPNMSLQQALSNSRTDGFGALYREGTASLLNSMANKKFPYTTNHVRDSFVAALSSNKAAATQARLFKMANEGRLEPRA